MQMCGLAPARPWSDHRRTPPSSPITRCTRVAFCPCFHRRRYLKQTAPRRQPCHRSLTTTRSPAAPSAHRPPTTRAGDLIYLEVKDAAISPTAAAGAPTEAADPSAARGIGYNYAHAAVDDHPACPTPRSIPTRKGATAITTTCGITGIHRVLTNDAWCTAPAMTSPQS